MIGPAKPSNKENPRSCVQDIPQSSPEHLNVSVKWEFPVLLSAGVSNWSHSELVISKELLLLYDDRGSQTEFNIIVLISVFGNSTITGLFITFNRGSFVTVLSVPSSGLNALTLLLSVCPLKSCSKVSVRRENGCTGTLMNRLACISFSLWILLILFNSEI